MEKEPITKADLAELPFGHLQEIPQPPESMWLRGSPPLPGSKLLTVVGSRALTRYGREACDMLIGGLSGYPISIVSGLALGADACAHEAALAAGLHTIAIPGGGISDAALMPRSNRGLAHRILKSSGLLMSEHPPDYLPYPFDFPLRNRIMVGMADAVLIIEAGPRSGTLITAGLAGEYGRHLLCVPHRIGDPHGFGAHKFIREGATIVTDPLHILEALHIASREEDVQIEDLLVKNLTKSLNSHEKKLYKLLATPLSRDELIRASDLAVHETLTVLISLEIKGLVREEFGAWRRVHT